MANELRALKATDPDAIVHIFAACPNSILFDLGQKQENAREDQRRRIECRDTVEHTRDETGRGECSYSAHHDPIAVSTDAVAGDEPEDVAGLSIEHDWHTDLRRARHNKIRDQPVDTYHGKRATRRLAVQPARWRRCAETPLLVEELVQRLASARSLSAKTTFE